MGAHKHVPSPCVPLPSSSSPLIQSWTAGLCSLSTSQQEVTPTKHQRVAQTLQRCHRRERGGGYVTHPTPLLVYFRITHATFLSSPKFLLRYNATGSFSFPDLPVSALSLTPSTRCPLPSALWDFSLNI